jgi:hypothetical protein
MGLSQSPITARPSFNFSIKPEKDGVLTYV